MKFVLLFCLVSLQLACSSEDPEESLDCATLELTYDNFGASFMDSYCTSCHSAALTGAERQSAPTGINFDSHADVLAQSSRIRVRTVDQQSMPPLIATKPGATEIADLADWLECGAP